MKFVKTALLIFAGILISACSKTSSGGAKEVYTFETEEEAIKVFNNSRLTCKDKKCPEYAGGLTTYTVVGKTYEVALCTLTLVGHDTVLTNKHCIPVDLQSKGASCFHRVKVKFPAIESRAEESLDCEKILNLSDFKTEKTKGDQPDWAIIQLKTASSRKSAALNLGGIENRQTVHLYPIYYSMERVNGDMKASGEMRRLECTTDRQAQTGFYFFHKLAALFGASECSEKVIAGNSGSGLFSVDEDLLGVASFGTTNNDAVQNEFGGTNLACIDGLSKNKTDLCSFIPEDPIFINGVALAQIYGIFNQDHLYQVSPDNFVAAINPLWLKSIDSMSLIKFTEDPQAKVLGALPSDEAKAYLQSQMVSFAFKDSAKCVTREAPDWFQRELPVYNIKFHEIKLEAPKFVLPIGQSNVIFEFSKTSDGYSVIVKNQTLDQEQQDMVNRIVATERLCMTERRLAPDKTPNVCYSAKRNIAVLGSLVTDQTRGLRTNLFLKRNDALTIEFKTPFCD